MNSHVISFSKCARFIGPILVFSGVVAAAGAGPGTLAGPPQSPGFARESAMLPDVWTQNTMSELDWLLRFLGASPDDIIKATTVQDKMNLVSTYYGSRGLPAVVGPLDRATLIANIHDLYESIPEANIPLDPITIAVFQATLERMWLDLGLPLSDL